MTRMYIAANTCVERGMFLGDTLVAIKIAHVFVETEPHDEYVLSMQPKDKWNFLWDRFIREYNVQVVYDTWRNGDKNAQYSNFDQRRRTRTAHDLQFDTYKEIYPRLDGGGRQAALCGGREVGLCRVNILQYFYYGQERCVEPPPASTIKFGPGIIDFDNSQPSGAVIIAPHEKCQSNRVFTLGMWMHVVNKLLALGETVIINSMSFMTDCRNSQLSHSFAMGQNLVNQVANAKYVACGNTGIGWVAAATGTPLVACERNMIFGEYSFLLTGCESLKCLIQEPVPDDIVKVIRR